jgi:hypothetical protein
LVLHLEEYVSLQTFNEHILTIITVSERVARSFSSPDQRVHLVGDAA